MRKAQRIAVREQPIGFCMKGPERPHEGRRACRYPERLIEGDAALPALPLICSEAGIMGIFPGNVLAEA